MSAIYFHIPFCKRLCGYCDFFKSVKLHYLQPTLEVMERELIAERSFLTDHNIETIYFGGGTPSLVDPAAIKHLIDVVKGHYCVESLSEVTLEVNPDDISHSYLEGLRAAGVNRLSIGIQSFDDEELRFMNRRHNGAQAVEAVRLAQSVGFDNITIDLIFGVEGFGVDILERSLSMALSLGVQHISAYHLTIESGTPFARRVAKGDFKAVDDSISQIEYALIDKVLTAANFEHYEVSNYALSGYHSRHNSSYWQGVQYLGIGPGAHSYNGLQRRYVEGSIESYLKQSECIYQVEELSMIDRYNEYVMTSLRCCEGVDLEYMRGVFPSWIYAFMLDAANNWLVEGKLCCERGRLYIPIKHFMISDLIIESLFYCSV
ncbi:MAG: radical SAM family heme chaperone HemW [Rikenellaceae bacterium]